MAPKPEKSESGSISCKHGTEGLHGKNIWSVPTFFRSGPIFSCSVNGALMQLPSENACEGRNQPEPGNCCQNRVVAAQRVFCHELLDQRP